MEQTPQNPGVPALDSAVQGSPLPGNTVPSNAAQGHTAQSTTAESAAVDATAVPTVTALQSPEHEPAVAGAASTVPSEAVATQNAPAEPKRMGLYSLICLPTGGFTAYFIGKHSLHLDVLRLLGIFLGSNGYSHHFVCCFAVRLLHLLCSCSAHR